MWNQANTLEISWKKHQIKTQHEYIFRTSMAFPGPEKVEDGHTFAKQWQATKQTSHASAKQTPIQTNTGFGQTWKTYARNNSHKVG